MTEDISTYSAGSENSRLAMKLAIFAAVYAAIMALLAFITGIITGWSGLGAFTLGAVPFTVAAILAFAAVLYGMLSANAAEEEYEKELLKRRKESSHSIIDVSEDVRFTAGRTFSNYCKYAPGVFSVIALAAMGLELWSAWSKTAQLGEAGLPLSKEPLALAFVCVLGAAFSLFAGVFLAGQSSVREFRWLRPVGAWLAAGAGVWLAAAIPAVAQNYGHVGWEMPAAKTIYVVLILLAAEFVFSFIAEFYRPRTLEDRPVFESRILALFIEPGSVAKNITDALDYQFGFKVSGTNLFGAFCKVALPAILLWLAALWLFTGIAEVGAGEVGVRMRFGAVVNEGEMLQPGAYFKLPWPCETIERVPVDVPRTVMIGVAQNKAESEDEPEDDGHGHGGSAKKNKGPSQIVLWTAEHTEGEIPFLVANNSSSTEIGNAVSMLNAVLPVSYKVKKDKVYDYLFSARDVKKYLTDLATREATLYFASTDFISDLSVGRLKITEQIKSRIQSACDKAQLGLEIITVDLTDTHPPMEGVAPAFQDVFCAQEQMGATIENAKAYAITALAKGKIETLQLLQEAEAYKNNVTQVSASEGERFRSQLEAYNAMPRMFKLRTYLDFLENDCADLRKYIISSSIQYQIIELNAEEKPRLDLLDSGITGE